MAISKWTNLLLPRLPGASKTLVESEVVQTIDNFCRDSLAWRSVLYGFNVDAGNREIPVYYGADGSEVKVVQILRVYYEQNRLPSYSHVPWETTTNRPTGWSTKEGDPSIIELSTIPTTDLPNSIDAWVALAPVDPVSLSTPLLEDTFWEIIYDGVLGRMYSQNDKPYSDQTKALYHLTRYRNGTRKGRDMGNRGFTGNAQNWTFPKFGR